MPSAAIQSDIWNLRSTSTSTRRSFDTGVATRINATHANPRPQHVHCANKCCMMSWLDVVLTCLAQKSSIPYIPPSKHGWHDRAWQFRLILHRMFLKYSDLNLCVPIFCSSHMCVLARTYDSWVKHYQEPLSPKAHLPHIENWRKS